jgi:hypothetical protein
MNKEHLEIHYYFNDQSHSMEAEIYNKCSEQIVIIFKEIAQILEVKIDIEIEGAKKGSLRQTFKIFIKNEYTKIIFCSVITNLLTDLIMHDSNDDKLKNMQMQYYGNQIKEQQLKELKQKKEIYDARSTFYENSLKCPKIKEIEYSPYDQNNILLKEKVKSVLREDFSKFIISKEEPEESEIDNDAVIKVIAPVIQKTKNENGLQWVGIYQDKQIRFNMADKDFQRDVINEKYKLSEIKTITSVLEITFKTNINGEKIINSEKYRVVFVEKLNDKIINQDNFKPKTSKKNKIEKKFEQFEQQDLFKK